MDAAPADSFAGEFAQLRGDIALAKDDPAAAHKAYEQALAYEQQTLMIIDQLGAENQLENSGRQLLEALSFGLYDGYSQRLDQLNELKQWQAAYKHSVEQLTLIFFVPGMIHALWLVLKSAEVSPQV